MNIDSDTQLSLIELAARKKVSVNRLLSDSTDKENEHLERKQADMEALRSMTAGGYITQNDMQAHLDSLRAIAKERR